MFSIILFQRVRNIKCIRDICELCMLSCFWAYVKSSFTSIAKSRIIVKLKMRKYRLLYTSSVCVVFWGWPGAPLSRAWLHFLCTLPSGICKPWWDPAEPFLLQAEQYLLLQPFCMLVTLRWALLGMPRSVLYWGAQHRTAPVQNRGEGPPSLHLLAALMVVMLTGCCKMEEADTLWWK